MNYKLDKEYIVKVLGHESSPILYYRRSFYLSRTSFARGSNTKKNEVMYFWFHGGTFLG